MDILLGVGLTLYALGLLFGLFFFFCLHIGLEASRLPFALRFTVALVAAILWPLGFSLYGPFMGWKRKRDRRSFDREQSLGQAKS